MKKLVHYFFAAFALTALSPLTGLMAEDITHEIPEIKAHSEFQKIPNVAQYKEADWSQAIGIARGISLSEAFEIAKRNPDIEFFFYTKGYQMVLEKTDGTYRIFRHGDTVFFGGEPWWGSAPDLADGYEKIMRIQDHHSEEN